MDSTGKKMRPLLTKKEGLRKGENPSSWGAKNTTKNHKRIGAGGLWLNNKWASRYGEKQV